MGWEVKGPEAYSGEVTSLIRMGKFDAKTYQTRAPLFFHIPPGWKGHHVTIMTYNRFLVSLKPGFFGGNVRLRLNRMTLNDGTAQENEPIIRQGTAQLELKKPSGEFEFIKGNHMWHGLLKDSMQFQLTIGPEFQTFRWGTCYMKVWKTS